MPDEPQPTDRRRFLACIATGTGVSMAMPITADAAPSESTLNPRLYSFVGGKTGHWSVLSMKAIIGDGLTAVERIDVIHGQPRMTDAAWVLRGVISNMRYTTKPESEALTAKQVALGRKTSTHAAIIPIRKSPKWWALTQDERRSVFEDRSRHTTIGLKYLPAIARRLHHCRDLGESEPFDFITYFDFAKDDTNAFDDMLAAMRASEEWKYIDREIDIRLQHV